jgi:regulator of CtrA degradation
MPGIVHTLHGGRTIAFAERIKNSSSFKTLFADGMKLVEEAAAYLDGPGRDEAKGFNRALSLAYATESMRLTTRLMQLASWLLLQRAVNEGEMSQAQAAADKHKVKVQRQELATAPEAFARLPERLRVLCERSLRLQSRILHLDAMIYASVQPAPATAPSVIETRFGDLRRALERL